MKTHQFFLLLFGACTFAHCDNNRSGADETTARDSAVTNKSDHTKVDTTQQSVQVADTSKFDEQTIQFMNEAASGGMMEVTLGQAAQNNAASQRVKDFGSMMVRDHSKANDELKSIAGGRKFTLPPAMPDKHQDHVNMLSKKTGADFDKAYMKMMVDDHEKDIKAFEKAANSLKDTAIKGFAARTLPILRTHLDSARAVRKQL